MPEREIDILFRKDSKQMLLVAVGAVISSFAFAAAMFVALR